MTNAAAAVPSPESAPLATPVVSLRELLPWALFAIALLVQIYVVAAVPSETLHELLHDGRHLLGVPCH